MPELNLLNLNVMIELTDENIQEIEKLDKGAQDTVLANQWKLRRIFLDEIIKGKFTLADMDEPRYKQLENDFLKFRSNNKDIYLPEENRTHHVVELIEKMKEFDMVVRRDSVNMNRPASTTGPDNISDELRNSVVAKLETEVKRLRKNYSITEVGELKNPTAKQVIAQDRIKAILAACKDLQPSTDPMRVKDRRASPDDLTPEALKVKLKTLQTQMMPTKKTFFIKRGQLVGSVSAINDIITHIDNPKSKLENAAAAIRRAFR